MMTMKHTVTAGGAILRHFEGQPNINLSLDIQETLMPDGDLRLVPSAVIDRWPLPELRLWLHIQAIYCLPTSELIEWLRSRIGDRTAIEVGSGHGLIGKSLGIPCTDKRIQDIHEVRSHYRATGQPVIRYPAHVERLDGIDAITKYRPQVVVAAWVTHQSDSGPHGCSWGLREGKVLKEVEEYIFIGHTQVHGYKPILSQPHDTHIVQGLRSRSCGLPEDVIWTWKGRRASR